MKKIQLFLCLMMAGIYLSISQTAKDYYLPLNVGNYTQLHTTSVTGTGWSARTTIYSIIRSEEINGVKYFLEEGRENSDELHDSWVYRNVWLRADEQGNIVMGAIGKDLPDGNASDDLNQATIFKEPSVMFPNKFLKAGEFFSYAFNDTVVGIDSVISVNATAGSYKNCIQVRDLHRTKKGVVIYAEDCYYAYHVGLVKQHRILPANQTYTNYIENFLANNTSISKTLTISSGGLNSLTTEEKNTISTLKITGTVDARDFKTMRDELPQLAEVDLSGATVVAYSGPDGTSGASTTIDYPANAIPIRAFYNPTTLTGKKNLAKFIFPSEVTSTGKAAFRDCSNLKSITIPPTVKVIGEQLFYNCNRLSTVLFESSSSLKTIGKYAFGFCSGLTSLSLPKTVSSIGMVAFLGSKASISVDSDNPSFLSLNGVLYNKQQTRLIYCPNFKTGVFDIPTTVTSIAADAFYNCQELTSITIPPSVKILQDWAFENCTGLSSVNIPASVDSIGGYVFYKCKNLKSIYANASIPVNISASDSVFNYVNKDACLLYVPKGSKGSYQVAEKWKDFKNILETTPTYSRSDLTPKIGLSVYPNPTDGLFKIEGLNPKTILSIYSIEGKLVKRIICNSSAEIVDIRNLENRTYLLYINEKAFKILKK